MLSLSQAAKLAGMAQESVRTAALRGQLPASWVPFKFGETTRRRWRFSPEEVLAWAQAGRGDATLPEGMADRYLTIHEAAQISGLSPQTIYDACWRGVLPARRGPVYRAKARPYEILLSELVRWRTKRGRGSANRRKELPLRLDLVA